MSIGNKIDDMKLNLEHMGVMPARDTGYVRCNLNEEVEKNGLQYKKGIDYDIAKPYDMDKDMGETLKVDSDLGLYIAKTKKEKPGFKGLIGMVYGYPASKEGEQLLNKLLQIHADHYNLPIIARVAGKDVSLIPTKTKNNLKENKDKMPLSH
ncbi:MAG: hypothetical protein VZR95_09220 [Alphaproteobacteria bacterium]